VVALWKNKFALIFFIFYLRDDQMPEFIVAPVPLAGIRAGGWTAEDFSLSRP
jgi:hypothetical protein